MIALALLAVFDVLVLIGVVPSNIVWGGQIQDTSSNLIVLELVALVATLLFLVVVAAKLGYLAAGKLARVVDVGVWIIFAYLVLNTLGNLASGVTLEKLLFTPITIVMALLALRLAIEKGTIHPTT